MSMGRGRATAISLEIPMSYAEYKISIDHQGREYSAAYKVENGIVSVVMKDGDGSNWETSTFIDGSTAETVAKSLLGELLKDMALLSPIL
jgi:hypothetical protein